MDIVKGLWPINHFVFNIYKKEWRIKDNVHFISKKPCP